MHGTTLPAVLRRALSKRSVSKFIRLAINCKLWAAELPTVGAARPARCVGCGMASIDAGRVLVHGHGRRERQQRGPALPGDKPRIDVVRLRRYQCQRCGAVMTAAPEQVQKHKHFSACAIGWALALFGLAAMSAAAVREQVSPWCTHGTERWATLLGWARQARSGVLFANSRGYPPDFTLRQVAARCANTLAAMAASPWSTAPPPVRAFFGAARAR